MPSVRKKSNEKKAYPLFLPPVDSTPDANSTVTIFTYHARLRNAQRFQPFQNHKYPLSLSVQIWWRLGKYHDERARADTSATKLEERMNSSV